MAHITLDLAHSYKPDPRQDSDYALLPLKMEFEDGGAYALLGPSGCGKTTMLNIMSGLLVPSHGKVLFDGRDVTRATPQDRNIAQVFQFPVIYDTMTVIDPHLKWQLRRKLKQIHHELKLTLIYVTHDQVEALTFADQVVVMTRGRAVQVGSADALFERPQHVFVGHFIGSPGMNFLPAQMDGARLQVAGHALDLPVPCRLPEGALQVGVRPEYLALAQPGQVGALPCTVLRVQDIGTYFMLTAQVGECIIRARFGPEQRLPSQGDPVWLQVLGEHTCYYQNEELLP